MYIPLVDSMDIPCYDLPMSERYASIVKAWSLESSVTTTPSVAVTKHAIERCQQRVAPSLTCDEAHILLQAMVSKGRSRATPRKWTKGSVLPTQGLRFVYWFEFPDVCGLVVDRTLVTVVTRPMCRRQRPAAQPRSSYAQHRRRLGLPRGATHQTESDEDDV